MIDLPSSLTLCTPQIKDSICVTGRDRTHALPLGEGGPKKAIYLHVAEILSLLHLAITSGGRYGFAFLVRFGVATINVTGCSSNSILDCEEAIITLIIARLLQL